MIGNEEIAVRWRLAVQSDDVWVLHERGPNAHAGMCEGRWVTCAAVGGRPCYLKPSRSFGAAAVAAREKIASDLAHDLGVPVPPFVLAPNSPFPEALPGVSLAPYGRIFAWRNAEPGLGMVTLPQAALPSVKEAAARLFAFDVWLEQVDHGPSGPNNLLLGFDPRVGGFERPALFGIDFEKSMHFDQAVLRLVPFPQYFSGSLSPEALFDAAGRIESLPADIIEEVVRRVPVEYLDPGRAAAISAALIDRKARLTSFLKEALR